ncbi:MAG TPA: glycosyltransferase [Candidatus Tectomicrobia bacterium]|nr:glycosyltransferase [Candidatus Tectomicrobia bacterium]
MALHEPARVGEGSRERIDLSVIVPILNEVATLEELAERLICTLHRLGKSYEVIFIDDGSTDDSAKLLKRLYELYPTVKVIRLNRNYGQHMAILAGLDRARGEIVVTLDGDLQNPPEEIPRLLEKIQEGYDVVCGQRTSRQDPLRRKVLSYLVGKLASRLVGVPMRDYGSMLRAYRRPVIDQLLRCRDRSMYIPALANALAASVTEIPVDHQRRAAGNSRYNFFGLLRLTADLVTGFSLWPIRIIGLVGTLLALLGMGVGLYTALLGLRGSPQTLVSVLTALLLFVAGLQLLALGLIGEYVGRTYMEVQQRPRYGIQEVWE